MIYERVKKICDEQGISIRECENRANLGNGVIGGWRESSPRLDSIQAVARVLNVPLEKLTEEGKLNE